MLMFMHAYISLSRNLHSFLFFTNRSKNEQKILDALTDALMDQIKLASLMCYRYISLVDMYVLTDKNAHKDKG